jgi:hypothetical protein
MPRAGFRQQDADVRRAEALDHAGPDRRRNKERERELAWRLADPERRRRRRPWRERERNTVLRASRSGWVMHDAVRHRAGTSIEN